MVALNKEIPWLTEHWDSCHPKQSTFSMHTCILVPHYMCDTLTRNVQSEPLPLRSHCLYSTLGKINQRSKERSYQGMERIEKHEVVLLCLRSQSEKFILLYDSNYITFWKRLNHGDSKKISDCHKLGEGGMNTWNTNF